MDGVRSLRASSPKGKTPCKGQTSIVRRRESSDSGRALIFVNGQLPDLEPVRRLIQTDDALIAADGGTRHILALGLLPTVVIGDLDSLEAENRQRLEEAAVGIRQYPADKDETDLELAFNYALEAGYRTILIIAALGGRLDQTLANLSLLSDPRLSTFDARLDDGVEEAFFVRKRVAIAGNPGDTVSLLPWGVPAEGVTTKGLRWPLHAETLHPAKTRGVSNEMLGEGAAVSLQSGLLLVIHRRQT
jgi:thiamine pyrophosphokinase